MDRQILNFTANEQVLTVDEPIRISTNKVNYIEAHFALGTNWSGYDSVRAVWFNDYQTISTVLDSQGVCRVPFEVMKRKGQVKVDLVGSISEGDVLTDRLTSYPVVAVVVDCVAPITGAETSPITPSQFEQFVSIVISEVEKVTGMTAQAETLPAGSQATAHYENGILYLGIPQGIRGERGETGADGADGNGIASVVYNADYSLTLIFDNGERFTTPPIRGERGPAGADGRDGADGADGVTPNLSVGNVTTLDPSQDAYVTRRGTDANPIFDFGIPKGDTGTVPDLDLILPTDTASGDIASIPDGQSVVPVKSLKVTLEPIQDLHGYDKPWSGGAGKNKFNVNDDSYSYEGVTISATNNVITIVGTAASGYPNKTFPLTQPLPAGTYTISATETDSSHRALRIRYDGGGYEETTTLPYTFTASASVVGVQIATSGGNTYNDRISNIQIESGSTATSWTPYSNICPISGHTECVTEVCGKNLFDKTTADEGYIRDTNGEVNGTLPYMHTDYISVVPNATYYVKTEQTSGGWGAWYDSNKTFISSALGWINNTLTAPSNARYVRLTCVSNASGNLDTFAVNYPSTDHEYHAYDGNTYTTDLGRTVYGGTLDVVSGELVVDRAIVDLGTLSFAKYGSDTVYYASVPNKANGNTNVLSDKFFLDAVAIANMADGSLRGYASNANVYFRRNDCATLEEWNTWLSNNPTQLCYELATPQTYQLDPQTISLLHGNNNVWSDGEVEMVYNADVGLYIDKKLGTSGTRTLSMTRTLDTKSEETKTDAELTKSDNIQLAED